MENMCSCLKVNKIYLKRFLFLAEKDLQFNFSFLIVAKAQNFEKPFKIHMPKRTLAAFYMHYAKM